MRQVNFERKEDLFHRIFFLNLSTIFFFENLKIVEKNAEKLNCSYGKLSHALNY